MFIKDVCLETQATKKAIEYYIEQGLITPIVLENGYRDFSASDCEKLKKISMFRKLGLSVEEIKKAIDSNEELSKIAVERELNLKVESAKKNLIDKISTGANTGEILKELKNIEKNKTITEKLLEAFPGYYGRFIALHFSAFLNEPISTVEQQEAYDQIVKFLDEAPNLDMPEELKDFFIENTKQISVQNILEIDNNTKKSIEEIEAFLKENKEILEFYIKYKQSDEYKSSPVYMIQKILTEFNSTSGYYDVFIPAMKELSASYAEYCKQLEIANEKLIKAYPEIGNLNLQK